MKITDFATVVDKTIPTDFDPDFVVDYGYGTVLFDDELKLDESVENRYIDSRIRLVVVQSECLIFGGEKVKDNSAFTVYLYAYDKDDGYGAITFDGSMDEIKNLGGLENFIYEIITNEKEMFIDRGSSVCTGDMPEEKRIGIINNMLKKKPVQGMNDLASLRPDIAEEWDYDQNEKKPYEYAVFSSQKVWWKCRKDHTYKKAISERTRTDGKATGCPYCANKKVWPGDNDLETWCRKNNREELLLEWDYEKNQKKPSEYLPHTDKKVNWVCSKGHSFEMRICEKTKEKPYGCPICSGKKLLVGYNDLKTLFPEVAAEWDYEKNDTLPEEHVAGTHKKAYWICRQFGHQYQAQIKERAYGGTGCPKCAFHFKTSVPEQTIFFYVKQVFPDAVNSYKPDYLNGMEIDIYIPSITTGIEYDGKFWHSNVERDGRKSGILKEKSIKLIRIKETDDRNDFEDYAVIHSNYDDRIVQMEPALQELFEIISMIAGRRIDTDIDLARDEQAIYTLSEGSKKSKSLLASGSEVLSEWAYDLNGDLTPDMVTPGSNKSVIWICSKCGKAYQQSIKTKVIAGLGCESCNKTEANNRRTQEKIVSGKIKSVADYPLLLKEWNDSRDPKTVSYGNDKPASWKCSVCGNEFEMIVKNRTTQGQGCPKCGRRSQAITRGKPVMNVTTGDVYYSIAEAERRTGVASAIIRGCCNGKFKQAGGFVWRYEEKT